MPAPISPGYRARGGAQRPLVWCIACAVVLAIVAPQIAHADVKLLPGHVCNGNTSSGTGGLRYGIANGIENDSTTNEYVYCPLVREDSTVDEWDDLEVAVHDGNDAVSVTCYAYVVDKYGSSISESQSTGDLLTGDFTLDFGTAPVNTYGADATFMVRCLLPADDVSESAVYGYTWTE